MAAEPGRVELVPRRIRATLAGRTVLDTTQARYVWEFPFCPQDYISVEDVDAAHLLDEERGQHLESGTARYYIPRTDVALEKLRRTACPYKGVTSDYRSLRAGGATTDAHQDIAWPYAFPTGQLLPVAGLVAFYTEKVDLDVDGVALPRARTRFA